MDHWLLGPVESGIRGKERETLPTIMGVGALERLASCSPSPYTLSRNVEAERTWASEASVAANDASSEG